MKIFLMQKDAFNSVSEQLFSILANNVPQFVSTGGTYEKSYSFWKKSTEEIILDESNNVVLIYNDSFLVGFFQYSITSESFKMEEIQIMSDFQGKKYNAFRELFGYIFSILPSDIDIKKVEAYASKQNYKSQGILRHLGLDVVGEDEAGIRFHYQGDFSVLMKWYNHQ